MKSITVAIQVIVIFYLTMHQVFADEPCVDPDTGMFVVCGGGFDPVPVPEIDGSGAIIAIGLVVGVVALVRERFYKK